MKISNKIYYKLLNNKILHQKLNQIIKQYNTIQPNFSGKV